MKKKYRIISIILSLFLVVAVLAGVIGFQQLFATKVAAQPTLLSIDVNKVLPSSGEISEVLTPEQIKELALDEYEDSTVIEKSVNLYEISYPGTGSKIEIGDTEKSADFKPDLEVFHWNDEVSFKLIAPADIETKSQLTTSLSDSLIASSGEWIFEYKTTEPTTGFNEFGGLDIFITAKEKPSSNEIYFTYDSSTVTPYEQPPLTEEFKDGWSEEFGGEIKVTETQVILLTDEKGIPLKEPQVVCERPDYVVGSIAFYADGKANHAIGSVNYAAGKVGQLYAMQANGQWCRWTVEGSYIVLTIPYEVFDKATYPVTIAPVGDTFGYTSVGGSSATITADDVDAMLYSAPADGTATSISVYGEDGTNIKGLLLTHSDLNLVANGVGNATAVDTNKGWDSSTFGTPPSITNGTAYLLGFIPQGNHKLYYDNAGSQLSHYDSTNSYATPQNLGSVSHYNTTDSIYCTYTPSSSFDISNDPSSEALGILAVNTTYYAFGSAPSNPVEDGECTFTITNNGSSACDVDMKIADFTGGVGWNIDATPEANEVKIVCYYSGQNPASGLVLTNSDQEFYDGLAASATIMWDFLILTGTSFTDGVAKEAVLTITAVAED